MPVRIAHFSDLHLCPELGTDFQIEVVLALIEDAKRRKCDHFVFTGDFVDYANLDDLSRLYRVFRQAGLKATNTTIIPGNHDIFPIPGWGLSAIEIAKRTLTMLRGNAQGNYESFIRRSRFVLKGTTPIWHNESFPFIRKLSKDVLLVGVDSTNDHWTGRLQFSKGSFDPQDAEAILETLHSKPYANCQRRILAIHHLPIELKDFRSLEFKDVEFVQNFIVEAGFDLVLCGHVHFFGQMQIGQAMVVCSGCHFCRDQSLDTIGYSLINLGRSIRVEHFFAE